MASRRHADPAMQLEVDESILDYLLFSAIEALLWDFRCSERPHEVREHGKSDIALQMVDSFLPVFNTLHPSHRGDPNLLFRLRLLKFTALFTRRHIASSTHPARDTLQKLRLKRQEQAKTFNAADDDILNTHLPSRSDYFASADNMTKHSTENRDGCVATGSIDKAAIDQLPSISLLDTLPIFMSLSAAENAVKEAEITDIWMRLAAGYMAQAVTEQYLVYKSQRSEVLQEAFGWGFNADSAAEEGSDEWLINAMFWGEDEKVAGWEDIRDEHMRHLIPVEGEDLTKHLKHLISKELPLDIFEEYIVGFLHGLLHSHPRPILAQAESRAIDGLTQKEIKVVLEKASIANESDIILP